MLAVTGLEAQINCLSYEINLSIHEPSTHGEKERKSASLHYFISCSLSVLEHQLLRPCNCLATEILG